ncbi:MAG: UvrD-helicase domain-containing protein, partial [Patescibacteria group bacterium]
MKTWAKHLTGLNDKQKEAATHTKGPLLIVAGAGAGKTKTITHRIVNLIKGGVAPEKILAVTFTNKAAKEMRERILGEIEKNAPGQDRIPFVSTFHSLGVHIIKENAKVLGLTRYFTILDEDDAKTLIKEAVKELGHDPKQYAPGQIRAIISMEKGNFMTLEGYREKTRSSFQELVWRVWRIYETKKAKENALDFDDLLLKTTKLLKENEAVRKIYQERWEYIHIDEYQDTNEVQ